MDVLGQAPRPATRREWFGLAIIAMRALLGSLGTVIYRAGLDGPMLDALPSPWRLEAQATLGAAISVAELMPPPLGATPRADSGLAFTDALQLAALIGALIVLAASVIAARILRRVHSN